MKKLITAFVLTLLSSALLFAQDRNIKGTVTSKSDGSTIPGVSVYAIGTDKAAVTDINGQYSINVPPETKKLKFSSLGMKTKEVETGALLNIDIVLESDELRLDEVVITANAIEREKRSIGYGITTITSSELTKGVERSVFGDFPI